MQSPRRGRCPKLDEKDIAQIQNIITRELDVKTKMIDVVKAYTKHEQETMFKTIELTIQLL